MPRPNEEREPRIWAGHAFPWMHSVSRRDLLRLGSISLSAAALPGLARPGSTLASAEGPPATAKSVIFLWMAGGVTHIDTFDPKPEAPSEVRGTLGAIDTALPGVRFNETVPCLAAIADRLAVVRSYSHDSNDHFLSQAYGLSGRKVPMSQIMTEPNIGAIVSYLHGPRNQLPGYMAVPGITRPGPPPHNLFVGGWLGEEFGPFAVGGEPEEPDFTARPELMQDPPAFVDEDLQPPALAFLSGLDSQRLAGRASLRHALEASLREAEGLGAMEGHYQNAFHLLSSAGIRQAFDLSREADANREAYGRSKIGNRCLMACRLVEAGARFVMVDYGYDPQYGNLWDNHNAPVQNHPPICEMVKKPYHVTGMDRAFAAMILDLERRGLLESTLVVFMTEFGRTPKINSLGGRDHWGPAGSMFFAGGGTRAGQIIGATDKQAGFPTTRGFTPGDVAATIYRAIGIDPAIMLRDRQNRPLPVLPEGEPIEGVLS
jgi:hypothetical protein